MKKLKELVAMFSQSDTAGMGPYGIYGIYSLGIEKQIQTLTHRTSVPNLILKFLGLQDPDPSINKQKIE